VKRAENTDDESRARGQLYSENINSKRKSKAQEAIFAALSSTLASIRIQMSSTI